MRICSFVLMVGFLAWGYWWLILIAAVFFLFMFSAYYEILLWGICFDALYAAPQQGILDYHAHGGVLIAIIFFIAAIFLKKRLAFYS